MTLGHIAAARERAEATLDAVCTIRRPNPDATATVDPTTGAITRTAATTIATGVGCTVVAGTTGGAEGSTGSRDLHGRAWDLILAATVASPQPGDEVTVTAVADTGHSDLVGVPLTVAEADHRSRAVLRRVRCVDVRPSPVDLP